MSQWHNFCLPASLVDRKYRLKDNDTFPLYPLRSFLSQVSLLPPALAHKRVWNKKYPICLTLAEGEAVEESVVEEQEEEEKAERHVMVADHQLPVTLYLFGRTGREKEEWFQHFLSASQAGAKSSVSGEESTGEKMFWFIVMRSNAARQNPCFKGAIKIWPEFQQRNQNYRQDLKTLQSHKSTK